MRYPTSARFWTVVALAVLVVAAVPGCGNDRVTPPGDAPAVSGSKTPTLAMTVEEGVVGPGAQYALYVPDDWNGDLVIYAHGFVDAANSIALPTNDNWELIRDHLVQLGYAVAYSSFSANGFAVKEGMLQTHQLRGIFIDEYGVPARTYLMGHSLGAAVAVGLVEKFHRQYAGALLMCGMIGGSEAQIDYVGNVRVLFDYCYPGALRGSVLDIPADADLNNDVIVPVATAIQTSPDCALAISQIDQTPVPFSNATELVQSFVTAIAWDFRGFDDVNDRTHSHVPFDNGETVYTGMLPQLFLDAVNAGVQRYTRTPDANAYLEHNYQPTGDLAVPVLTLHNALDPSVPDFHEEIYGTLVDAAGHSQLLVQRTVTNPVYGHCVFGNTPEEVAETVTQAFQDLVNWVETGMRPSR